MKTGQSNIPCNSSVKKANADPVCFSSSISSDKQNQTFLTNCVAYTILITHTQKSYVKIRGIGVVRKKLHLVYSGKEEQHCFQRECL